jgi:hypothetical protein
MTDDFPHCHALDASGAIETAIQMPEVHRFQRYGNAAHLLVECECISE